MASLRPDITLIRGDTSSISLTLTGIDLTGATVFFTAKAAIDNAVDDSAAAITVETTDHVDPANGVTSIPLSSSDTNVTPGEYYYDIQVKKADNSIISIPYRKLEIVADITRRTS